MNILKWLPWFKKNPILHLMMRMTKLTQIQRKKVTLQTNLSKGGLKRKSKNRKREFFENIENSRFALTFPLKLVY